MAAGAAVVLLAGCGGGGATGVRTATVGRGTVTEVVEAPGSITARASAVVTASATGSVGDLRVHDGQHVDAGQVLLRIDSPDARRSLTQAKDADRQAAEAADADLDPPAVPTSSRSADRTAQQAFQQARDAAQAIPDATARAQALSAAAAAQAQYDTARAQADQAIANFNAGIGSLGRALASLSAAQRVQTRAAVQLAQRAVDALVVRAPIAGTVGLGGTQPDASAGALSGALSQLPESLQGVAGSALGGAGAPSSGGVTGQLVVGTPVASGQQLLTVTDASGLALTAQVDETDVLLVRPGVQASADLDAVPGAHYDATVRAVDVAPQSSTAGSVAYVVRLELGRGTTADGGTAPTPRPGMSAVIDLSVRTARDVVAVPAAAVFRDGQRDVVWAVRAGTARKQPVQVGAQGADLVEIRRGVTTGATVVVAGADKVRAGQRLP